MVSLRASAASMTYRDAKSNNVKHLDGFDESFAFIGKAS